MKKLDKDTIIESLKNIHDNKYDYSLSNLKNLNKNNYKIKIICPIHGEFEQNIYSHIKGYGCKLCKSYKQSILFKKPITDFIKVSNKIHKNKYDYSLVEYKNNKTKVKIICPIHGVFEQTPKSHSNGNGCKFCYGEKLSKKLTKNTDYFISKSKKIHNNKYNYSLVEYVNSRKKVNIICKKHGVFQQQPYVHLLGHGCPFCLNSKGEKYIKNFLLKNKIKFIEQKIFETCRYILPLKFDFYLLEYNTCIEYDGIQHFKPLIIWGGEKELKNIQKRDKIKNEYCKNNNIKLYRIKYTDNIEEKINEIISSL